MKIPDKLIKVMDAYAEISRHMNQRPSKLSDLPDAELVDLIEDIIRYKTNIPLNVREKFRYEPYVNGLKEECSKILSDRIESRKK